MPAAQGRRDANHAEVVKAFEDMFCGVVDTSALGFGFPDVILHFAGFCIPCEIKTEEGELNSSQRIFMNGWRGPKIPIIRSRDEAILYVAEIRERSYAGRRKLRQP
jgi:hypothetical protein